MCRPIGMTEPIVLHVRQGQLFCQSRKPLLVNGQPADSKARCRSGSKNVKVGRCFVCHDTGINGQTVMDMWTFQYKHGDRPLDGYHDPARRRPGRIRRGVLCRHRRAARSRSRSSRIRADRSARHQPVHESQKPAPGHDLRRQIQRQGRPFVIMEFVSRAERCGNCWTNPPPGSARRKPRFSCAKSARG